MGNCFTSIPPDDAPKCAVCGASGRIPWGQMSASQKNFWATDKGLISCKKCKSNRQTDKRRFHKERQHFKYVKEQLYPRPALKVTLKKIKSGEGWDGTASFYESWKPSSIVAALLPRKGTAMVVDLPDISDPASEQPPQLQHAQPDMHTERAQQLEKIERELMSTVEEEDIEGSQQGDSEGEAQHAASTSSDGGSDCHNPDDCSPDDSGSDVCQGSGPGEQGTHKPHAIQLLVKLHTGAFGSGIVVRGDTANEDEWSPVSAGRKAGGCCAKELEIGAIEEECSSCTSEVAPSSHENSRQWRAMQT